MTWLSHAPAPVALALLLGSALPSAGQTPATFNPAVDFATGSLPITVAIGDVNNDGKQDLVAVNTGSDTVSVLLGNGAGSFAAKTDFATGATPHGVAVIDLDGDGNLDIAVANTGANTVSVLLGNGSGNFGPKTDFATGAAPFFVAAGDLDADGIPDLAVVNVNADTVSVLLGAGDGSFGQKTDFATGAGARSVAIGDLNGDGAPDLAVANVSANTVSVLLGTGTGSFAPKTDFATGAGARDVAVADVNGDGRLDVIVANANANTVSVLLGAGDGTLGPKTDFAVGAGPRSVAIGDVNEDGKLDLVTANFSANTVSVLLGIGDGSFAPKSDLTAGAGPFSVAIGDFNGNGQRDLAAANVNGDTVSVFLNTTSPVIAVTPNSQGFGNVTVGSTADRSFTVTNTGGGVLAGSASTSAPFSVIAGGNYSLGAGGGQTVTVRFSPTTVALFAGNVNFTYSGGSVSRGVSGTGTNPIPVATSLSPGTATAGGAGFTLTVAGSNFVASSVVRWNGANRTTTFVNSTQVRAAIPSSDIAAAGTAQVTVFDPLPGGGTSAARTFTIGNPAPIAVSLTPNAAKVGGAGFTLTVAGSNFLASSVVRWNGANRTTTFVNSTQVRAAIPSSDIAAAGTAQVTVFDPLPGGGTSAAQTFTIGNPAPIAVSLTPNAAKVSGAGFTLTVAGSNFVASSVVRWNGANRTTTFVNSTQLKATIPASDIAAVGSAQVTVFNPAPVGGTSAALAFIVSTKSVFTDPTITGGSTAIKVVHITELRSAIDTLRANAGLSAFNWTDPTLVPAVTPAKRIHVIELRTALDQTYEATARTPPTYTDQNLIVGITVIRAIHVEELRSGVNDLE